MVVNVIIANKYFPLRLLALEVLPLVSLPVTVLIRAFCYYMINCIQYNIEEVLTFIICPVGRTVLIVNRLRGIVNHSFIFIAGYQCTGRAMTCVSICADVVRDRKWWP